MKVAVIIVCAGRGKRLGRHKDKAVIKLAGIPLLYHTFKAFVSLKEIREIVLVLRKKNFSLAQTLITARIPVHFVQGGKERQDSVKQGLSALSPDITHVLIHDGARPFVSKRLILRVIRALRTNPAVICAVKAKDTLKTVRNGFVTRTLDRTNIYCIQTPQGFNRSVIVEAYKKLKTRNSFDDAQVAESFGKRVKVVQGENSNFKITYPEEAIIADAIITGKLQDRFRF